MATVAETADKLERSRELAKTGYASKQALDSAEAAAARALASLASAEAQVAVSEATLSSDETALSKTEIKSPINGVVLSRSVEPGQVVAASFQTPVMFKLAEDLAKMQLEVDVDEADIGNVIEKLPAAFVVVAYQNRQFPADITQVRFAPKTVDNVVTYQAVLTVNNVDLSLRPGMTATATITIASRVNVLLVPNSALRSTRLSCVSTALVHVCQAPWVGSSTAIARGRRSRLSITTVTCASGFSVTVTRRPFV